jgi:hypothetical protein
LIPDFKSQIKFSVSVSASLRLHFNLIQRKKKSRKAGAFRLESVWDSIKNRYLGKSHTLGPQPADEGQGSQTNPTQR